jgi:ferredoxin
MTLKKSDGERPQKSGTRRLRRLLVDVGACSRCCGCVELAPQLFRLRPDTGLIEVIDTATIDEELVAEVMKFCPEDCIHWDDD